MPAVLIHLPAQDVIAEGLLLQPLSENLNYCGGIGTLCPASSWSFSEGLVLFFFRKIQFKVCPGADIFLNLLGVFR